MPERDDDFLPIAVFREFEKRIDSDIKHNAEVTKIVQASAKEAIEKAENAQTKRFDNLNEFNQRMKDLTDTYLPRETYNTAQTEIERRIRTLENNRNISTGHDRLSDPLLIGLIASAGGFVVFIINMLFKR